MLGLIGKDVEGSDRGLNEMLSRPLPEGTDEKPQ
jgi:hypothetical protein